MTTHISDDCVALLIQVVDHAFHRKSWHGTTLRGSLRGLTVAAALWRSGPGRHNIWELILHTAYWKYVVRRKLTDDTSLTFPRSPSNWPSISSSTTPKQLKSDIALLQTEHDLLRQAILDFPPSRLNRRPKGSEWTYTSLIHGVAAHDLYHAGQIQLLKKLMPGRG